MANLGVTQTYNPLDYSWTMTVSRDQPGFDTFKALYDQAYPAESVIKHIGFGIQS